MHVCPCMESCMCKGLEVLFLGCISCGHVVMLLPMNKHMAGGSREGKLREEGLHGASWGATVPRLGIPSDLGFCVSYYVSHINPHAGTCGCIMGVSTYFSIRPGLRKLSQFPCWGIHSNFRNATSIWRTKLVSGSLISQPYASELGWPSSSDDKETGTQVQHYSISHEPLGYTL